MEKSCCFIGHRKIIDTPELRERLQNILLELIENGTVNFIFGDHSAFNDLCYQTVTLLKEKYPAIRRIHYRKDYENANDYTMQFLLTGYEDSICPEGVGKAGVAGYLERNQAMIRESQVCIFYYDENYMPPRRKYGKRYQGDYQPKSGTQLAYEYAEKKNKKIINLIERK